MISDAGNHYFQRDQERTVSPECSHLVSCKDMKFSSVYFTYVNKLKVIRYKRYE